MTKKHLPPPFAPLNGQAPVVQQKAPTMRGHHAPPPSRFGSPSVINMRPEMAHPKAESSSAFRGVVPNPIASNFLASANVGGHAAANKHKHAVLGAVQPAVKLPTKIHMRPSTPIVKDQQPRFFGAAAPVIQKMDIELGYESYEGDSGDELEDLGAKPGKTGIHKTRQYKFYDKNRNIIRNMFKERVGFRPKGSKREKARSTKNIAFTSGMLKSIVFGYETGTPGANTHLLVRKNNKVYLYQGNTANGVKLVAGKLMYNKKRVIVRNLSARSVKKKNTHTEMYRLYDETGHDVSKVKNVLSGQIVTVDKPCCRMCYYWMKAAGASVRDGTSFSSAIGRDSFAWTNPFNGETFTKKKIIGMSDAELDAYVKKFVK